MLPGITTVASGHPPPAGLAPAGTATSIAATPLPRLSQRDRSPVNTGIKAIARPAVTIAFRATRAQCRRSAADTRARPESAKAARPRPIVALIRARPAAPGHRRIAFLRTCDVRRPRNRAELRRRQTTHRRRCDVQARRSRAALRRRCAREDRGAGKEVALPRVKRAARNAKATSRNRLAGRSCGQPV